MKMSYHFKVRGFFVLTAALGMSLSIVSPAFAFPFASWIGASDGGGWNKLGTLGGNDTFATGINDSGQVVGESNSKIDSQVFHAFITGPNGVGMTDLGTLDGGNGYSSATGINDAGQVVGYSSNAGGSSRAFVTGPNGVGMTDLGTLPGGSYSAATGINAAGQVVGYSVTAGGEFHAFITGPNGGGMTDFGTFGGSDSQASWHLGWR